MRRDAVVVLEGARNCRDLGGYRTASGRRVRPGALFRSDRLNSLSADDLDELASRGIRTVVDFRAGPEIERDRSRLWASVTSHISLPVGDTVDGDISMVDQILAGRLHSVSEADMVELYMKMLLTYGERFAQFVSVAADIDHLPMLFHCTAGKDRSGLAAALVLEVLGVDRATVLDDYCVTNELRSLQRISELTPQFAEVGIDIDDVRPILCAPRQVMAAVLAELDTRYRSRAGANGTAGRNGSADSVASGSAASGPEGYLLAAGLNPGVPEMLRANLLI